MENLIPSPCYDVEARNPNEIWKTDDILERHTPLLAVQIALCIFFTSIFYAILRPLRQPRIVAEVLAGFATSLFVAADDSLADTFMPAKGILSLETYANLGIMCYVFLSGLEMNFDSILQVRKNDTGIAFLGIVIPIVMGMGFFGGIQKVSDTLAENKGVYIGREYLFWCLALPLSSFPLLARILTDLKLLYTRMGKAALRAAMFSDTYGWVTFVALIPFSTDNAKGAILSVFSTMVFILLCIFVLRPLITKHIDQDTRQNDSTVVFLLIGVFVCSYITDFLGTHPVVGAFVYGLILPHGQFTELVMGKLDNFVTGAISPLFFFRVGLTMNLRVLAHQKHWPLIVLVILLLATPKVLSTYVATFFFDLPARHSIGIGLLLNIKGALALIMLNMAWDRQILSAVTFTIMVCAILAMTVVAPLFINSIYKPRKRYENFRMRTIEMLRNAAELRILSCVHNPQQAICMVTLLKTFNANRISPLHVFGVHLVELTGEAAAAATALLADQMDHHLMTHFGSQDSTISQSKSESTISNIFTTLQKEDNTIRVDNLQAVSDYRTIHEDIHSLVEQNLTALILLPFHKQPNGLEEETNEAYREINLKVMQDAPCSMALLVDRGLGLVSNTNLHIVMVFVGGPDDREALAFAWRMVRIGNSGNTLSMVRIILAGEAAEARISTSDDAKWATIRRVDDERQQVLDGEYIDSFRFKAVYNNDSITYSEEEVHNGEELVSLLQALDKDECDLYIVGQGNGRNTIVFSSFMEWCDNPELGVIGDIIASSSIGSRSSVLVVKQFGSEEKGCVRQIQQSSGADDV
ncbi:hypothetical protein QN277_003152 [Acacia crassicarpa]|uniref:Cation/H+ exchanger domain-containing protein n=1 Tax=Acacia crassicarpa TaxID=499986 RepID=A0AAE1MCD6_9FABA|nr:hypothetical protein QN277_003152 [Acacia crassicarpa]